jgi:hypothetical protein
MTTRRTAASIFGLFILYRELPISEGHGFRDVLRVCACVNFMTRTTGSPMRCLVDVNEMKIAIAVTKFSGAGSVFFRRKRRIVTAKTKIVIGNEKGRVKALLVLVCQ